MSADCGRALDARRIAQLLHAGVLDLFDSIFAQLRSFAYSRLQDNMEDTQSDIACLLLCTIVNFLWAKFYICIN